MHVNHFMLLGGGLRGTLPNPEVVTDEASMQIAVQVFGRRSTSAALEDAGSGLVLDEVRAFLPHPELIPRVRAGVGITITEDVMGPTVSVAPEMLIDPLRAFLPHPQRIPEVQAGTNITIVHNARGPVVSATGGGSFSATQTTLNMPFPAMREHTVNVVDAAVTATDKIIIGVAGVPETDQNSAVDLLSIVAVPLAGSFNAILKFLTPAAGPLVVNYARSA